MEGSESSKSSESPSSTHDKDWFNRTATSKTLNPDSDSKTSTRRTSVSSTSSTSSTSSDKKVTITDRRSSSADVTAKPQESSKSVKFVEITKESSKDPKKADKKEKKKSATERSLPSISATGTRETHALTTASMTISPTITPAKPKKILYYNPYVGICNALSMFVIDNKLDIERNYVHISWITPYLSGDKRSLEKFNNPGGFKPKFLVSNPDGSVPVFLDIEPDTTPFTNG